jgi:1-acyl-sn-glycerol-3-phosphate acyltransferase
MELLYLASNIAQRLTLWLFSDYKVEGKENVPPMGPLLVVSNHMSNMDPPLLGVSLPRRTWFLAKDNMFRGRGRRLRHWFLTSYGGFPLNREGTDIRAYRWALRKLEQDGALVVFPEGTRSKTGSMGKGLSGVVRLALKTQAPLIPVAITGTERLGSWARVFNPTGTIRVKIGTVFSLPSVEGKLSPEVLDSLTETVMRRVAALLPESYRGVYRDEPVAAAEASVAARDVGNGS